MAATVVLVVKMMSAPALEIRKVRQEEGTLQPHTFEKSKRMKDFNEAEIESIK